MKIRRQLLWIILIFIVVIFISQFPLYYASLTTPDGFFFTGQASWFDPWDINVYVSAIKYGQQHGFLLENLYSTEVGGKVLYYPMYTLIGMIFPQTNPFTLFQSFNILAPFFIIYIIYKLSSHVMAKYKLKRKDLYIYLIVISTALGRGIGWLMPPIVQSADLFITSFSMRSSFQRPHEGIGTLLYFVSMLGFFLYLRNSVRKYMYISFVASLFLILFYPYYLLMFFVVNAIQILIVPYNDRLWKFIYLLLNTLVTGILTYLYYLHLSHSNFVAAIGEIQPKLTLLQMVSGYGAYVVVFLITILSFSRKDENKTYMVLWVVVGIVFSYLPFGFARFFLRGLFYPLSVLLAIVLIQIRSSPRFKKMSAAFIVIFILLTVPSAIFIFSSRISETGKNNPWYYLPEEYGYSYGFISTLPKDGILSTYMMGNVIPAYTGKRVYIGHVLQTPNFTAREKSVRRFYRGDMSSSDAFEFLNNNQINYVYYSHFENLIGTNFADYKFLTPIYKNKGAMIFEVDKKYRM